MFRKAFIHVLIVISWVLLWESFGGSGDYRTLLYFLWINASLIYIVLSITMPIINRRKIAQGKEPERIEFFDNDPPLVVIILICVIFSITYFFGEYILAGIIFLLYLAFAYIFGSLLSKIESKGGGGSNRGGGNYKPRGQKVFCSHCNKHLGWGDHVRRYCDECNLNDNYVVLTDLD